MKSSGRIIIPSITVDAKDLEVLLDTILRGIDEKTRPALKSKIKLVGNNFMEEYDALTLPNIDEFHDGLKMIEISMDAHETIEISITMCTEEVNPFSPRFSYAIVEASNSTLVAGILDEIRRFFRKRRNFNSIFHPWGIPVAIALAFAFTYAVYFDLKALGLLHDIKKDYLVIFALILSHPLKSFLRWAFPYILFKGENRFRDYTRFVLEAILLGAVGNLAYAVIAHGFSLFSS